MTDKDFPFGFDPNLLLYALGKGRGEQGFTLNDGAKLLEWAAGVIIANEMINMMLAGDVVVVGFSVEGEPLFTSAETGLPAVVSSPDTQIPLPIKNVVDAAQRLLDGIGQAAEDGSQDAAALDNSNAACSLRLAIWDLLGQREGRTGPLPKSVADYISPDPTPAWCERWPN